ncbi:hypothetical protein BON22_4074 [Cyberlindnera fabianii]|uniref:Uncharacterized protein n=1 Tax=Cyberlindnera fabianii TaxID=36022 RepID=A0A1V2L2N7_CYBFA|nr:hypothetical protein BON22_4074 [Cyberlindnera fabianii]
MTELAHPVPHKEDTASSTHVPFTSDAESSQSFIKSPTMSVVSDEQDSNTNAQQYLSISRPLSRASVTSGLSVTATKDGVEGKTVKRHGIPGYPLNLMNKMYSNYVTRSNVPPDSDSDDDENTPDRVSVESLKSFSMSSMIPHYSQPETLRDVSDSEVYGEDTVEFDRESKTDYEKFLMQRSDNK